MAAVPLRLMLERGGEGTLGADPDAIMRDDSRYRTEEKGGRVAVDSASQIMCCVEGRMDVCKVRITIDISISISISISHAYQRRHMSRSSSRLQTLLLERNVSQSIIDTQLTITQGDIRDTESVARVLTPRSKSDTSTTTRTLQLIISGIGRPPIFSPNPLNPTFDDPTVCQDAISTILAALRTLPASSPKPVLAALSTTGISSRARDIPILMIPLYHWLLAVPHKDKLKMEALLQAEVTKPSQERVIKDFVVVRPSLLTDGARLGTNKIRVGEEVGKIATPAVGYTISREDVGGWMFDQLLDGHGRNKYEGKMPFRQMNLPRAHAHTSNMYN
ncbi:MAG: hypothetical protein Q9186_006503 [Xanthomendoza sp. 1 TL-2023]